ncbi:MAG: hypothetical protein HY317_01720 [Acidobacteria bacterium]|nr:hypothetical protein [Acidobacteriota bacterium]
MKTVRIVVLLALALAACGSVENPAAPGPQRGLLEVRGVEVAILESFPTQVIANVEGQFPTVCTAVDEIRVRRRERVVEVTITTVSTATTCILLYPPPVNVPVHLGYFGETGEYVLRVNGFETRFKI